MVQGKWQEWEERHFPFGTNELLDQLKLHVELHLILNLPTQSNYYPVTIWSATIYSSLQPPSYSSCLRESMVTVNHWKATNPQDLSPVLSPTQHTRTCSPSHLPLKGLLVHTQLTMSTSFPFSVIFQELPSPLPRWLTNKKIQCWNHPSKALEDRFEAYSASYQHWDLTSSYHSNKHTNTDTPFSKTLPRVLLMASLTSLSLNRQNCEVSDVESSCPSNAWTYPPYLLALGRDRLLPLPEDFTAQKYPGAQRSLFQLSPSSQVTTQAGPHIS